MLTTGVDVADGSGSSHDGVADTFKFTNGNEKIVLNNDGSGNYDVKSLSAKDSLKDVSTTDNDILQLNFALAAGSNIIGAKNIGSGVTIENIEEIDIIGSGANRTVFDNTLKATGLKTLKISGDFVGFDFNGKVIKDLTKIDATGITSVKSGVTLDASGAKQSLTIDGPNFAATVKGGAGDDIITAQGSVDGGAGNDIIYYTGESTVNGDAGDDIIEAAANAAEGAVSINGDAGKDLITVNGEATVNGGDDDDIITINGAADVSVDGGSGNDKIIFAGGYAGTGTVINFENTDILEVNAGTVNADIAATYNATAQGLKVVSEATLNLTLADNASGIAIDISAAKIDADANISITSGTGADTITLSAGNDTIVFGESKAKNGKDTINKFSVDNDVLDFTAFAELKVDKLDVGSTAEQVLTANNKIYQTTINEAITTKDYGGSSDFGDLFATSGKAFKTDTANGNKELIVVKGNDVTQIYYVNATATTLTSGMVDLVAVIGNDGGVTLSATNFA